MKSNFVDHTFITRIKRRGWLEQSNYCWGVTNNLSPTVFNSHVERYIFAEHATFYVNVQHEMKNIQEFLHVIITIQ